MDENTDWIVPYIGKIYKAEGLRTFYKQYTLQDSCKGREDAYYYDCMYQKMNCGLEKVIETYKK